MDDRSPFDRLRDVRPPEGAVGLAWLGQAGFVVRARSALALIDPFLSPRDGRRYESSLLPERAQGVDVVLCTHEHVDHFDAASAPAIARASPGAIFVVPTPIVDMVTGSGIGCTTPATRSTIPGWRPLSASCRSTSRCCRSTAETPGAKREGSWGTCPSPRR